MDGSIEQSQLTDIFNETKKTEAGPSDDEDVDIGEDDVQAFFQESISKISEERCPKSKTHTKKSPKQLANSPLKRSGSTNVSCDTSDEDDDSPETVAERLQSGCECAQLCFKDLDPAEVYKHRLNIAELTKNEHDMYLMGVTMASMANSKTTARNKERQRQRASYVYQGKRVCLDAFMFLENVTLYHIKRIRNHVLTHGITPRTHGNSGKKPHNAFSLDTYRNVENYLRKYLKAYIADFSKPQIIYGITRVEVYNSYKDHGRKSDEKLMGYSTFRHFMKEQFPTIRFIKIDPSNKHSCAIQTLEATTPKKKKKNTKLTKNICQESCESSHQAEYVIEEVIESPKDDPVITVLHTQNGYITVPLDSAIQIVSEE